MEGKRKRNAKVQQMRNDDWMEGSQEEETDERKERCGRRSEGKCLRIMINGKAKKSIKGKELNKGKKVIKDQRAKK